MKLTIKKDLLLDALNKVYKQMYHKDLYEEGIEYALSFHFY